MFQESKTKRGPMQIVGIVVIFILAVLIILTFVIFGIFRNSNSAPKLFGKRVYVVTNDRMETRIPNGAAVFVNEGELPQDGSSSVILCNIENELYVIGFVRTEIAENGDTRYIVKYDNSTDDRTWGISAEDIVGVAEKYDSFLGWVIRFASSKLGMMLIVIIPCVLLIVYEVIMLVLPTLISGSRRGSKRRRTGSDEVVVPVHEAKELNVRRAVGINDIADIPPERENIQAPIDVAREEKFVEKQLRRANDKLSHTVLESTGVIEGDEINLDPIKVEPEVRKADNSPNLSARPEMPAAAKPEAERKPDSSPVSAALGGDLSASRIDELIKLLEEEKKRLEDK